MQLSWTTEFYSEKCVSIKMWISYACDRGENDQVLQNMTKILKKNELLNLSRRRKLTEDTVVYSMLYIIRMESNI